MSEEKKIQATNEIEDDMKVQACDICCEIYNITTRKKITCNFCNYIVCASCFKKYITSMSNEPHCMSCKKKFSREFLTSYLTKHFINNDFKKHQEELLLEQELAMMPSTQVYLEYKKQADDYSKEARKIGDEISRLTEIQAQMLRSSDRYYNMYSNPRAYPVQKEDKQRNAVSLRPCPAKDCRGFVNNRWNCGVCSVKVCSSCHEIKKEEHKCDPATVETVKLLKTETKNCPKCYTSIYKLEGCDQMWCTICKTAFSWVSGKIINGPVHNPHYFEYLRTIGREDEEIFERFGQGHCDRSVDALLMRMNSTHRIFSQLTSITFQRQFYNFLQVLSHMNHVEIPRYRDDTDTEFANVDLRISYLENKLDKESMKIKIHKRHKKRLFSNNIVEILQMYYDVALDAATEFFRKITSSNDKNREEIIKSFVNNVNNLKLYTNENIEKVKNMYGYKCYIDIGFAFT
jgi:hypothetical protein